MDDHLKAVDKDRVLNWFKETIIDNPDVEITSFGGGEHRIDPDGVVRYHPVQAYVNLRPRKETRGQEIAKGFARLEDGMLYFCGTPGRFFQITADPLDHVPGGALLFLSQLRGLVAGLIDAEIEAERERVAQLVQPPDYREECGCSNCVTWRDLRSSLLRPSNNPAK